MRHQRADAYTAAASTQSGFTLLELLTVIAVTCILAAITLPGFTNLIRTNRIASESHALLSLAALGRSESVKRMQQVTLCKSGNGNSCSSSSGVKWHHGMVLFADSNANLVLDDSETVIRSVSPFSSEDEIGFSAGNALAYRSNGASSSGTFTIKSGNVQRKVIISLAGRARIE